MDIILLGLNNRSLRSLMSQPGDGSLCCCVILYCLVSIMGPWVPYVPAWGQTPLLLWFTVPPAATRSVVSWTPFLKVFLVPAVAFQTRRLFSPRHVGWACGFKGNNPLTQTKPLPTAQAQCKKSGARGFAQWAGGRGELAGAGVGGWDCNFLPLICIACR